MTRVGRTYVKGTAAGAANDGYFGNGSDGALNVAAGQTFTIDVPSEDTQIIKNYSSVHIAAGATVKTSGRCNGVVWLVSGDFILDGTINVDKRAPLLNDNEAAAAQELHVALCGALNGGKGGNGSAGGTAGTSSSSSDMVWSSWGNNRAGGTGGQGFRLGGGYGGGGGGDSDAGGSCEPRPPIGTTIPYPSGRGVVFCGTGGSSYNSPASDHPYFYAGGAGPGGSGAFGIYNQSGKRGNTGDAIGGGAIWIFVMGQVKIGSTGIISACGGGGATGVSGSVSYSGGYTGSSVLYTGSGGGGGGGIIALVYSGGISNLGSLRADGGKGGANIAAPYGSTKGDDGAVGTVFVKSISDLLGL